MDKEFRKQFEENDWEKEFRKQFEENDWELEEIINYKVHQKNERFEKMIWCKVKTNLGKMELFWHLKNGEWEPFLSPIFPEWYQKELKKFQDKVIESDDLKFVALVNE